MQHASVIMSLTCEVVSPVTWYCKRCIIMVVYYDKMDKDFVPCILRRSKSTGITRNDCSIALDSRKPNAGVNVCHKDPPMVCFFFGLLRAIVSLGFFSIWEDSSTTLAARCCNPPAKCCKKQSHGNGDTSVPVSRTAYGCYCWPRRFVSAIEAWVSAIPVISISVAAEMQMKR